MAGRMGYYWTYYAATLFVAYAVHNPWVCGVVLAFIALRPWLPDPVVLARTLSHIGSLKTQVRLNAANVTARRDLGRAYLELRWPRTALRYLDEARARDPRDPEIAYLRGLALLRARDDEAALAALGEAVGIDPEKGEPFSGQSSRRPGTSFNRFGEAYLAAARALERLDRLPQAEEALAMSASCNSSLIEPRVRLSRVRRARGDAAGSREALRDARRTFAELPPFMRRKQLGWGLRSYIG
jgi:tetratricopeptide (TPR) repeat protein